MSRPPAPPTAEIEEVGRLLVRYWPGARRALDAYTSGKAPWHSALRTVRGVLREAITSTNQGHKLPKNVRNRLNEFAAKYGTETRSPQGVEAVTVQKTIRFAEGEVRIILEAAKAAGMTEAQFVRAAAFKAAVEQLKGTT